MERDIKYYQDRRSEIINLLDIPHLPADYRDMLENARDYATSRIQQLTDIAVMAGDKVRPDGDRALDGTQEAEKKSKTCQNEKYPT